MATFYSPKGNPEVWEEKPDGYFTPAEWAATHPEPLPPEPTTEEMQKQFTDAIQRDLDAVLAGQRPMPSLDEVPAELPPLAWPE